MFVAFRGRRYVFLALVILLSILILALGPLRPGSHIFNKNKDEKPHPKYIPEPTWTPPPVQDPFPALATSTPPPIPEWNRPAANLHKTYDLDYPPPLFIGFTRSWPLLLQCVVSYITSGWPANQIYVIENTGVQRANLDGKLSLQNPLYLNHTQLKMLGVNVIRSPVLMNFAQLQNYYTHIADENNWPYYFWSHMDVVVLNFEDGENGVTPGLKSPNFKTIYELCLRSLKETIAEGKKWANRFYAYDHLALVNRASYEAVGGWDTFIPYYMTDCDMHSRLIMQGYKEKGYRVGVIADVNTAMEDLSAMYRNLEVMPGFVDPNPPPPGDKKKRDEKSLQKRVEHSPMDYFKILRRIVEDMSRHKAQQDRNSWQEGQKGGEGEPYYYPARGIAQSMDIIIESGKKIFSLKWGHQHCDIITGAGLKNDDQWRVKPDWR